MSDQIVAKGKPEGKYQVHPEGQFPALCVDTIDLGDKVTDYPGTPSYLAPKCAIVFRTGEKNADGEFIDMSQEFTISMSEKANLRKALESWRGKPYSPAAIEEGVPLHKLTGQWALIGVAHKQSKKDRTYAVVQSIVGVPKLMTANLPTFPDYKRADYWKDRIEEYAKTARAFREMQAAASGEAEDTGFPAASDEDDSSLPF